MVRLPSLGARGEGWVALQFAGIGLVAGADLLASTRIPALEGTVEEVAGVGLVVAAIAIAVRGFLDLSASKAFTAFPYPRPDASLVETGAYRLVRHPLYVGLIVGGLGLALSRASAGTLLATLLLAAVLDLKRRREEAWLADRFPGYDAYRRRTRALIPFIY